MQVRAEVSNSLTIRSAPDKPTAAPNGADSASSSSRALVPLHPIDAGLLRQDTARYPNAAFLAHLIAVDHRLPQTRVRGRAAPVDAVAIYSATLAGAPARTGRSLRRSA